MVFKVIPTFLAASYYKDICLARSLILLSRKPERGSSNNTACMFVHGTQTQVCLLPNSFGFGVDFLMIKSLVASLACCFKDYQNSECPWKKDIYSNGLRNLGLFFSLEDQY